MKAGESLDSLQLPPGMRSAVEAGLQKPQIGIDSIEIPAHTKEQEEKVLYQKKQEQEQRDNQEYDKTRTELEEILNGKKEKPNFRGDEQLEFIYDTMEHIAGGAREGLSEDAERKIEKYVAEIRSGKDKAYVLQGLPQGWRDEIENKLLTGEKQQVSQEQTMLQFEQEKKILEKMQDGQLYTFENLSEVLPFDNEYIDALLQNGLQENVRKEDIRILFTEDIAENKAHAGGWFDSVTNTVVIQKASLLKGYEKVLSGQKRGDGKYENIKAQTFAEYIQITLVHELIHSVTAVITNMDRATKDGKNQFLSEAQLKSVTELKRIWKDIQGFDLQEYGTETIDELLAEIANKSFLEKLSTYPDVQDSSKTYKDILLTQFESLIDNPLKNPYFKEENRQKLVGK